MQILLFPIFYTIFFSIFLSIFIRRFISFWNIWFTQFTKEFTFQSTIFFFNYCFLSVFIIIITFIRSRPLSFQKPVESLLQRAPTDPVVMFEVKLLLETSAEALSWLLFSHCLRFVKSEGGVVFEKTRP